MKEMTDTSIPNTGWSAQVGPSGVWIHPDDKEAGIGVYVNLGMIETILEQGREHFWFDWWLIRLRKAIGA